MTFKLTYPAELDLSYFQPHVTYTCMSHVGRRFFTTSSYADSEEMRRRGFVVFGQVTTRRTLWIALSGVYGVMVAFGPTFLGEVGLSSGVAGAQHANCPFGWTHADNSCFK